MHVFVVSDTQGVQAGLAQEGVSPAGAIEGIPKRKVQELQENMSVCVCVCVCVCVRRSI